MEKPVEVPETTEAPLELILEAPTPGPSALERVQRRFRRLYADRFLRRH